MKHVLGLLQSKKPQREHKGVEVDSNPGQGEKVPYPYGRSNPIHKHFQNTCPGSPQKPGEQRETEKETESEHIHTFVNVTFESKEGQGMIPFTL